MKGNNKLHLNQATMIEALQYYLEREMPTNTPKVTEVSQGQSRGGAAEFEISVTDKEQRNGS